MAVEALPHLLGQEWAAVLSEAVALFGSSYPEDPDDRGDVRDDDAVAAKLDELDERFTSAKAQSMPRRS